MDAYPQGAQAKLASGTGYAVSGSGNFTTPTPARDTLLLRLNETAEALSGCEKLAGLIASALAGGGPEESTQPPAPGVIGAAMDLRTRAIRLRGKLDELAQAIA